MTSVKKLSLLALCLSCSYHLSHAKTTQMTLDVMTTAVMEAVETYMERIFEPAPVCAMMAQAMTKIFKEADGSPAQDKVWKKAAKEVMAIYRKAMKDEIGIAHFGCLKALEKLQEFEESGKTDDENEAAKVLSEAVRDFLVITTGASLCPCANAAAVFYKEVTGKPEIWEDENLLKSALAVAAEHLYDLSMQVEVSPSPHCNDGGMKVMQYYTELTGGDKGKGGAKPGGGDKPADESMKNKADRLKEKLKKNEEKKNNQKEEL